ncbi:haloacid dehalogenase type II [Rhizobiaceae bacterium n13]|uniref:Haloacid dehalogenase type II n=1 Tax=Ferirhizobium litorale TaxID=2927786 RepID=A0AAE3QIC2_9HYPH|nr:haloacid dehalogenase type II [Fererhizobium litorale]MDI7862723.1 haloacid dehalogenase type II [Fererhizobium litorale]MDI7924413.1 haloacid dehalogenase type II [Fererhizobium litorale]
MLTGSKPKWLTFDCYGTLIQWDEGLLAAVDEILRRNDNVGVDAQTLIKVYDKYEHRLEAERPHKNFRTVAGEGLRLAMEELGLSYEAADIEILTGGISRMPPFPEVVEALGAMKALGYRLCIISNTDDDIIAGNVAQLGGHVDRVITAQQAGAYKPTRQIFDFAHQALDVERADVLHICASPHLDLVAARDLGLRCIWIDRGTGRKPLPDYVPNAVFPSLDKVPPYLAAVNWG